RTPLRPGAARRRARVVRAGRPPHADERRGTRRRHRIRSPLPRDLRSPPRLRRGAMSVHSRWRLSLKRLYKVSVVAAIAFVPGWLAMGFVNAVAYGLAAAAGAHPTGRGNAESQLIAGAIVA